MFRLDDFRSHLIDIHARLNRSSLADDDDHDYANEALFELNQLIEALLKATRPA